MSDVGFEPFELPAEEVPGGAPPVEQSVEAPKRRGPRPGFKHGPRATAPSVGKPATVAKAPKPDVDIALMADVFGALSLPEAQAVGQLVQSFSTESQAAIARAVLKLAGE